jgi:hypothetical protein
MPYLAFDLEISTLVEGEDWKQSRPLGISCAAYAWEVHGNIITKAIHGGIWKDGIATPRARMTQDECQHMVEELQGAVKEGYTILTWNGLQFDFDILAEESGMHAECCQLAMSHVDMMFHIFCLKGYPLGLDTVAKGLGLSGKTAGMSGALAPRMWAEGKHSEVLEYVQQDVRSTLQVATATLNQRGFSWTSKSGRPNHLHVSRWNTVEEALLWPRPDTSWMDKPWPRAQFTEWMNLGKPLLDMRHRVYWLQYPSAANKTGKVKTTYRAGRTEDYQDISGERCDVFDHVAWIIQNEPYNEIYPRLSWHVSTASEAHGITMVKLERSMYVGD